MLSIMLNVLIGWVSSLKSKKPVIDFYYDNLHIACVNKQWNINDCDELKSKH